MDCAGECDERPVWAGPPSYVITDLGTLGGFTSAAWATNEMGQVVGSADTLEGYRHAFLWDAGVMTDLGTLPDDRVSEALDLNNVGQVVGISMRVSMGIPEAFLWEDGKMINLGHLHAADTSAKAINDSGQVVGGSRVALDEDHAFLWQDGVMTDLISTFGGAAGRAWDINELGEIVGGSSMWDVDRTVTALGTLGGDYTQAFDMNNVGQVVGWSEVHPGERDFHAILWENGQLVDLGAIAGFSRGSRAWGINDHGEVVGVPGFLFDPDEGIRDLESLLSANARWYGLDPRDINNAGQIVGIGTSPRRLRRAFLMTPLDGDFDDDGNTHLTDFAELWRCLTGPSVRRTAECKTRDIDRDGDVDLVDFRAFQWVFAGP